MNQEKFIIKPVTNAEEAEMFLNVPLKVYQKDSNWVQPLRSSIAKQLAPDNTFFQYGECQQFIAVSESSGEPLGRVVAAINKRLIERENQQIGLFGYFECVDNFEIAKGLLDKGCEWLQERDIKIVRGPIDLSTHNNCLLLVDGFDSQPIVMMPYNPSYYPEFIEKAGWQKAKDAYAYDLDLTKPLDNKFEKGYKVASKSGINFRQLRLKGAEFDQDCRSLYQLFTKAFANNWSSSKRTQEEFLEEAKDLQQLVDPNIFWIAEDKGEMIGFFMALPDYNLALKQVNGKLNWCGILKFLWYRRQIKKARVIAICALPEYRRKMVPLALIYLGMQGGTTNKKAYQKAELSWVWEDNISSRKVIEATGATICKTYRIYEKEL